MHAHGLLGQSGIAGNSSEDTAAETENEVNTGTFSSSLPVTSTGTRSLQAMTHGADWANKHWTQLWRFAQTWSAGLGAVTMQCTRSHQILCYKQSENSSLIMMTTNTQDRIQQSTIDQAIRHLVENSTLRITVVAKHKTDKTHCLQWIDIGIWINIIEAGAQKLKILCTSSRQKISSDWYDSSTLAGAGIMAAMSLTQQC